MKNQFEIETTRQQTKSVVCQYNNQCALVCSNKKCDHDAFICSDLDLSVFIILIHFYTHLQSHQSQFILIPYFLSIFFQSIILVISYIDKTCLCHTQHSKCPHLQIESIKNTLQSKIVPLQSFKEAIIQKIEKTIDELSDFKEQITLQLEKDLKLHGLNPTDQKFLCFLQTRNKQKLSGKDVFIFFNTMMTEEPILTENDLFVNKFHKLWSTIDQQIQKQTKEILKGVELIKENKYTSALTIFKDSKVVQTWEMAELMLKMFEPKHVESAKLIYLASEHNFSAERFHNLCDNIPHTLIFCETEFSKVIGGYTPLVWNKSNRQVKDESGNSFIFSLSNNHKFKLDKNKTAIYQYDGYGPEFGDGSPDFFIANNANTNYSSWSKINRSYFNENYTAENENSWQKFNGDPKKSYNFKVKEWEVWEIKLSQ